MALESFGQIAEQLRRSTVQVASGRRGQGSGFIVKSDGEIVTNAHVVGLRAGDMLIGIAGQPLRSLDDLEQALEGEGERLLRLQFVRGDPDKIRNVTVRLGVFQPAMA